MTAVGQNESSETTSFWLTADNQRNTRGLNFFFIFYFQSCKTASFFRLHDCRQACDCRQSFSHFTNSLSDKIIISLSLAFQLLQNQRAPLSGRKRNSYITVCCPYNDVASSYWLLHQSQDIDRKKFFKLYRFILTGILFLFHK